jgi:hypothetical protein
MNTKPPLPLLGQRRLLRGLYLHQARSSTAITRAKEKVIIVGQKDAFFKAIHKADVAKRNTVLGMLIAS